jgi:steroid delta-isomerase-like uncharacterized protein
LFRKLVDAVWNGAEQSVAQEVVDRGYVAHDPTMKRDGGPTGLLRVVEMFREGFPDLKYTIEDAVEAGDRLAVRFTIRGTHGGTFVGIPATEKQVRVNGMVMMRFAGGKLAEEWMSWDSLGLIRQLGGGFSPER